MLKVTKKAKCRTIKTLNVQTMLGICLASFDSNSQMCVLKRMQKLFLGVIFDEASTSHASERAGDALPWS
jgi:hypothetical protein